MKRLVLIGLGLALGLAAGEVLVRIAGAAPEVGRVREGRFQLSANPRIGYEPIPNLDLQGGLDSFNDFSGRSNSLGFRDREHQRKKAEGGYRLLLLGDSVAAGQRVERFEEILPARLEAELSARGLPWEVLNFAVTGYNTLQEVETLKEKGLAFGPDLVVVAYCLNDDRRSDGGVLTGLLDRARGRRDVVRSEIDPRLMRSALYRFLRFSVLPPRDPGEVPRGDTRAEAFDLLRRLADEQGFAVLVVVFPRFGKLLAYRFEEEHREVEALVRERGLPHLDLLAAFQACRRVAAGPLAFDRFHLTPEGHACAARALADFLARGAAAATG